MIFGISFGLAGAENDFFTDAGSGFNRLIPGIAFLSLSHNPSRSHTYSENVIMVKLFMPVVI